MISERVYAGFFTKRITGSSIMEDDIFGAAVAQTTDLTKRTIGECVVDPDLVGLALSTTFGTDAINERRLTVTGPLTGTLGNGNVIQSAGDGGSATTTSVGGFTIYTYNPDWYVDIPYENANGTTYRVYLTTTSVPVGVDVGTAYNRGYGHWLDVPGVTVNPSSVVDGGSGLQLTITTGLTSLGVQPWLTANAEDDDWSMDCVVWLDTDQTGVEIQSDVATTAIALTAKMTKKSGSSAWLVDLTGIGDGYLGQSSPSTTATDYKIAVIGPVVTTTNFDNNDDYLHVGTIGSATGSETVVTAGQRVALSVSDLMVNLAQLPSELFAKGWTSIPTYTATVGATDVTISSNGVAISKGRRVITPTGTVGTLGATNTIYVYYDYDAGQWTKSTDYDDAVADYDMPLLLIETDGSSQISKVTEIARSVSTFNETLNVTVSSTALHGAQFASLKRALAFCAAVAQNTSPAPKGFVIELVGDVTVAASIDDSTLLSLPNVTFRGRSGGMVAASSIAGVAGSKIKWSFDGALFSLGSGAAMKNWRFEDVMFEKTNDATAATAAVISNTAGSINGLTFERCAVDGNSVWSGIGGANGYLPHVVYNVSGTPNDLNFRSCRLMSAEAPVYNGTAANGITRLRMSECSHTPDTGSMTFSQGGFVVDLGAAGTTSQYWDIKDNELAAKSNAIRAYELKDSRIRGNNIAVTGDFSAIYLGNTVTEDDVERVFISDNLISQNGGSSSPPVRIITTDASSTVKAAGIIRDNYVDCVSPTSGLAAISINDGNGGVSSGWCIHDNVIANAGRGIVVDSVEFSTIHSNSFVGCIAAVTTTNTDGLVVGLNAAQTDASSGAAGGISTDADVCVANTISVAGAGSTGMTYNNSSGLFGLNVIDVTGSTGTPTAFSITAATVAMGNYAKCDATTEYGFSTTALVGVFMGNATVSGQMIGPFGTCVGNFSLLGDLDVKESYTVVGNAFAEIALTSTGTDFTGAMVGNSMTTFVDDTGSNFRSFVGNLVRGAGGTTFTGDDMTIVGNAFGGDVEVASGGDNWTFVGNRLVGSTFTDSSGTGLASTNDST